MKKNELRALSDKLEGWDEESAWYIKEAKKHGDGSWTLTIYQDKSATKEDKKEAENEEA